MKEVGKVRERGAREWERKKGRIEIDRGSSNRPANRLP